jgi:formyl-CoA transferase
MGRPELAADERFRTGRDRVRNAPETRRVVAEWTRGRSTRDAVAALGGKVPAGPVQTVRDIFADAHAKSRDMLVEVEQAGYAGRKAVYAGTPIKLTATPGGIYRRPPRLGEHTEEILAEFGIESGPSPVGVRGPTTEKETTP